MLDIVTVGSGTVDAFIYTDKSDLITIKNEHEEREFIAYPSGTKMLIKKLVFSTGGGGTNAAVALGRMGLRTAYIGALGDDENADLIFKDLQRVRSVFLGQIVKEKTDFSVILDSIAHDRTILNYKGSSTKLRFAKLKLAKAKRARWLYSSSLIGESYHAIEQLADFAKKNHMKVAFNPSSYLAERGAKYLEKMLRLTDVLILNKEEAQDITKKDRVELMLTDLKKFGSEHVIITDGKNGVHALCEDCHYLILPHKVKVVEATGAGDAFASTFVGGLCMRKNIRTCMQWGMANAEAVLKNYGAKGNLLTLAELVRHVRNYPYVIKRMK